MGQRGEAGGCDAWELGREFIFFEKGVGEGREMG